MKFQPLHFLSFISAISALPNWLRLPPLKLTPSYNVYERAVDQAHYSYIGTGPQPTIPQPTPTTSSKTNKCHRDNCLRGFLRRPLVGAEFCAEISGQREFEIQGGLGEGCNGDKERALSACECLGRLIPATSSQAMATSTVDGISTASIFSLSAGTGFGRVTGQTGISYSASDPTVALHFPSSRSPTATGSSPSLSPTRCPTLYPTRYPTNSTSYPTSNASLNITLQFTTTIYATVTTSASLSYAAGHTRLAHTYPLGNSTTLFLTSRGFLALTGVSLTSSAEGWSTNVLYPAEHATATSAARAGLLSTGGYVTGVAFPTGNPTGSVGGVVASTADHTSTAILVATFTDYGGGVETTPCVGEGGRI